jgi:acyl-CoA synthetase (AMP-forming)/AMP-acid ligase II
VGRPVPEVQVRLIRIDDGPIERFSDELLVAPGEIGEITVRGPVVTPSYWARPEQTALAKIREGDAIVHRMGDLGWQDDQGRIWMCGRKSHRVGTLYPVQLEEILNRVPGVRRTALVDAGRGPAIVIEAETGAGGDLVERVRERAAEHELPVAIFLLHPGPLPVDSRHNAKIEREKIARWAREQR